MKKQTNKSKKGTKSVEFFNPATGRFNTITIKKSKKK